jgi:hypothetical protein
MGNTVTLTGGTFTGNIYGAFALYDATGNTVTIETGATLGTDVTLYGGSSAFSGDAVTGNILNLKKSGVTIRMLGNFAEYNFTLPASIAAGSTVITASDGYDGTSAIDVTGITVSLAFAGAPSLAVGNKITLIDGDTYGVTGAPATTSLTASGHTIDIAVESGKLVATVTAAPGGPLVDLAALGAPGGPVAGPGWTWSAADGVLALQDGADVTLTGSASAVRVAVPAGAAALTLDGATIDNPAAAAGRDVLVIGANAKLTLTLAGTGANTLKGGGADPVCGLFVGAGAELTITAAAATPAAALVLDVIESAAGAVINLAGGVITAELINDPDTTPAGAIVNITGGAVTAADGIHGTVAVNGDAVVFSGAPLPAGSAKTRGVIFEGAAGEVRGGVRLSMNTVVPAGKTLAVPAGAVLTIGAGATLDNKGAIQNNGRIVLETGASITGNAVQGAAVETPGGGAGKPSFVGGGGAPSWPLPAALAALLAARLRRSRRSSRAA